ncbi:MAG: amidohydrolase family protein, partial [Planctomycetes bacterium]|nr:amidohydrolase family protein [Planctomycetota bacterium]
EALKAAKDAETKDKEKSDKDEKQADKNEQRVDSGRQRSATPPTRQQQSARQGQSQQQKQEQQKQEDQEVKKEVELPEKPEKPEEPKTPNTSQGLEPYRQLFAGEMTALVEAGRTIELEMAVKIFTEEFPMKTMFIGATDACRMPGLIPEKVNSVLVGPELILRVDGATINQAELVITRGGKVGFGSAATTGSRNLPLAVTYAVRRGLGVNDALAGLTSWPAEILGLEDRIGSIRKGCDADLVVLSGPPFELTSRVLAVMIDGEWVYQERAKEK